MSSSMYPITIGGNTALNTYGISNLPTIASSCNVSFGIAGLPTISAHLNLPVWDSVALWLDAADSATITFSGTGNGPAGYNLVSTWYDKSPNQQHLSQATTANQPYYHPTGFNGLPGIRFGYSTGGNTSLGRTGNFMVGNNSFSLFIVHRLEGYSSAGGRILSAPGTGGGDSVNDGIGLKYSALNGGSVIQITKTFNTLTINTNYQYYVLSILQNGSGSQIGNVPASNMYSYLNSGFQSSNGPFNAYATSLNASNISIGGAATSGYINGYLSEIIAYTRCLNASEQASVEQYLISKWGLNGNAPVPPQQGQMVLWLDAADNDMLTKVSQPTLNTNLTISTWYDKSGNGQHLSNTNLAQQPFYEGTGFNGGPGVRFGYGTTPQQYSGTQLSRAGAFFSNTCNYTAFFAIKPEGLCLPFLIAIDSGGNSISVNTFKFYAGIRTGIYGLGQPNIGINHPSLFYANSNFFGKEGYHTIAVNANLIGSYSTPSNYISFYTNGIFSSSNNTSPNIQSNINCFNLVVGTTSSPDSNGGYQGYISEIIIYNNILTISQISAVNTYLANKWGIGAGGGNLSLPLTIAARSNNIVPGPIAWWDAADTSTVLLGTGPNSNNNYVQFWYDKSGRYYVMNQGTAAQRPYYDPIGLGGKPTIKFGYTGITSLSFYNTGPASSSNFMNANFMSNDISMFCAMRLELNTNSNVNERLFSAAGAATGQDNINSGVAPGGYDGFILYKNDSGPLLQNTKYNPGNVLYDLGSNFIFSLIANTGPSLSGGLAGSNYAYYVNGAFKAGGVAISAASFSNYSTTTLSIGAAASNPFTQNARFALSECIIYNRAVNGQEASNINNYLYNKWNISNATKPSVYNLGSGSYNTGSISNIVYLNIGAWYDAAEPATMGLDNNGYVQNWYDKSGHSFTVTQGTAANRPYYNPTGYNSLPAVQFSGGLNTKLITAGLNSFTILSNLNAFTYFLVLRNEATIYSYDRILALYSTNTLNDSVASNYNLNLRFNVNIVGQNTFYNYIVDSIPSLASANNAPKIGSNTLITILYNNQSNNFSGLGASVVSNTGSIYLNGKYNQTGSIQSNFSSICAGNFYLGSGYGGTAFTGSIAEFILYTSTLTLTDKNTIENYLMTKWSISNATTSIPAPNTYFSSLTMWLDTNDTYLARFAANGSNITTIADKSLHGRSSALSNYKTFTGTSAPVYLSSFWTTSNNVTRPVMSFNATNKTILTGQALNTLVSGSLWIGYSLSNVNLSLFTVGMIDPGATQTNGRIFSLADSNPNYPGNTVDYSSSNIGGFAFGNYTSNTLQVQRNFPNSNNTLQTTTMPVGPNIKFQTTLLINALSNSLGGSSVGPSNSLFIVNINSNNKVVNAYSNLGVSFATSTITSYISTFALGGSALIGATNTNDMFQGYLGEVIAYARCVTDIERIAIESYLQSKWF